LADTPEHPAAPGLSEPERALATLLANLPGMAYRCLNLPGWPIQFLSQGCLELTGHPPEALVMNAEHEFADIIHPDDRARIWDEVQAALEGDRPFTLQYRIHTADGRERTVWERGTAVRDAEGEVLSLEGFIQDITERVQLEARVLEAQKLEVMGQLAGGVVHDINNMLMVIRSFLYMAELEQRPDASDDWVHPALQAVERGAALTRQLLTIARKQPSEVRRLELNALLEDFVAIFERPLGKLVHLELKLADGPVWVLGDAGQLEQVLMNLCINARDAMSRGGHLGLACRVVRQGDGEDGIGRDCAVIEVSDTGTGIEPAIQEEIFSPFFTTKPVGKGTGLGLSTVSSIVQQHQGQVRLHSSPGQGSRFEVWLPLHEG
jgi:two-component system, cell cycle sensor histidine kinase and response regulator CckA